MLPESLRAELALRGITTCDEVSLRQALEQRVETYTLIRLAPWPSRRWKCQYRLMMGNAMHDAQSVAEAYGLALLTVLQ
ncbi:MAG: hypothetical protein NVS4B12_24290 [Ktedonobacteraceae bacterium]